jgi:hypothetical protein
VAVGSGGDEQGAAVRAAEADVGHGPRNRDLAEPDAIRGTELHRVRAWGPQLQGMHIDRGLEDHRPEGDVLDEVVHRLDVGADHNRVPGQALLSCHVGSLPSRGLRDRLGAAALRCHLGSRDIPQHRVAQWLSSCPARRRHSTPARSLARPPR